MDTERCEFCGLTPQPGDIHRADMPIGERWCMLKTTTVTSDYYTRVQPTRRSWWARLCGPLKM